MSNKVALTQKMLLEVSTTKDILELEPVQKNWIATYEKTSGKSDGAMRFEAEKILFMQTVSENDSFKDCDRFSLYSCFIELAISGLSLRDGMTYIIPYKKKATFQVGWRGRLEQINEIPTVIHCHEPQVVFDCDEFEFVKGMRTQIVKHVPGKRTKENQIEYVYFVIEFTSGPEVYIMDRLEVLNIRDNYSQSYKAYAKALELPANKGKQWGDKLTISFKDKSTGQMKSFESDDLPMWVSDEIQAFKKTIVKRVWGTLPKLPKQKFLDDRMKERAAAFQMSEEDLAERAENKKAPEFNADDFTNDLENLGTVQDVAHEMVDEETGEIIQAQVEDEEETF